MPEEGIRQALIIQAVVTVREAEAEAALRVGAVLIPLAEFVVAAVCARAAVEQAAHGRRPDITPAPTRGLGLTAVLVEGTNVASTVTAPDVSKIFRKGASADCRAT